VAPHRSVAATHPAEHSSEVTREIVMLLSTILSGFAVLSVAFECPVVATVFGALAFYLVGHGA
jgi:hypothetical protein